MKATTLHKKITKFMEAKGFNPEPGWNSTSCFSKQLLTVALLIDITFEDGDDEIEVSISEVDGNHLENLEREFFVTIEEAQEFILNYFF
jgi:hypothetical protein